MHSRMTLPKRGESRMTTYGREEIKETIVRPFSLNFSARKGFPRGPMQKQPAAKAA